MYRTVLACLPLGVAGCDDAPTPEVADLGPAAHSSDDGGADDARVLPDFAPLVPPDAGPDGPIPSPDGGLPPQHGALVAQGPWGPAARVTWIDIPETPAAARSAGCLVEGKSAGSAVRNLIALAGGGLSGIVEPAEDGRISAVMLFRAAGWAPGRSALDLEVVDLEFYEGGQDAELGFVISRGALVDGEVAAGPRFGFPGTPVEGGWLRTEAGPFVLPLSLELAPDLPLPLSGARVNGRLAADAPGFRLDRGILTGYVTLDDARRLVADIKSTCAADEPPGLCALVGGQLDRPVDELVDLVIGILGGFEVRFEEGVAEPCDPGVEAGCNAVGLCVTLRARGVEVVGLD